MIIGPLRCLVLEYANILPSCVVDVTNGLAAQVPRTMATDATLRLRAAIQQGLDYNATDAFNVGGLPPLATLNTAELGISNLTGLELAIKLTHADLRNNIGSFAPVASLTSATIREGGNPGYTPPTAVGGRRRANLAGMGHDDLGQPFHAASLAYAVALGMIGCAARLSCLEPVLTHFGDPS